MIKARGCSAEFGARKLLAVLGMKLASIGKNLQRFIAANFSIQPKEQLQRVEAISDTFARTA